VSQPPINPDPEKVGIVLATYNPNLQYFQKQIESIQQQTWQNWVCHLVDDSSTPELQVEIQRVVGNDQRFVCHFYDTNVRPFLNFERGLQHCNQDPTITAIAFSDQDDIWSTEKLRILLKQLRAEAAVLVHSDLEIIDSQDQTLHASCWELEGRHPEKLTSELLLLQNTITGCSLLFCASLLPAVLPFPREMATTGHHDGWVALVASQLGKLVHLRQPLVRYRQHSANTIGAVPNAGKVWQELQVWAQQKKFRIVGKSYLAHRNLSEAFYQRFEFQAAGAKQNPFSDRRLDFGLNILRLGIQSFRAGYGAEGVAIRLVLLKFLFDLRKALKIENNTFHN
jgi:glycosyltransferase involved in cell wall biosynthesis